MRVIGLLELSDADRANPEVGPWALGWVAAASDAHWKGASDIVDEFPRSVHLGSNNFLFPIFKTNLALRVRVAFAQGIAVICGVQEHVH